jgi:hypothetical protein
VERVLDKETMFYLLKSIDVLDTGKNANILAVHTFLIDKDESTDNELPTKF